MSQTTQDNDQRIVLKNVRLSYPFIFVPRKSDDNPNAPAKYSASLLLDKKKDAAQIAAVLDLIKSVAAKCKTWKGKTIVCDGETLCGDGTNKLVIKGMCLRDGAEKAGTDGYGEHISFVSASRSTEDGKGQPLAPLQVVDSKKNPISAESGKVYGGCRVHASIRVWAQDNNFGKRINAELIAIMFAGDDTPFGNGPVDVNKEFAGLTDSEFDESPAGEEAPPPPVKKKSKFAMPSDDL